MFRNSRQLNTQAQRDARRFHSRLLVLAHFISIALSILSLFPDVAGAQSRVDLEDLDVKGELLNDNRLRMTARDATNISDRIQYRKNFRPEIIDGLDLRIPASETELLKSSKGSGNSAGTLDGGSNDGGVQP